MELQFIEIDNSNQTTFDHIFCYLSPNSTLEMPGRRWVPLFALNPDAYDNLTKDMSQISNEATNNVSRGLVESAQILGRSLNYTASQFRAGIQDMTYLLLLAIFIACILAQLAIMLCKYFNNREISTKRSNKRV